MAPTRNAPPEDKPADDESCEAFLDCKVEKRASSRGRVRLSKRLIPETGEILIEGWNDRGECTYTKCIPAGEDVPEDSPLAKNTISSSMVKTLAQLRSKLTAEEITAAEKAIKALDVSGFLEIIRGELYAA
jgi:hypothetical protein